MANANDHIRLSGLSINNNWYPARQDPMSQMAMEYRDSHQTYFLDQLSRFND